MSLGKSAEDLNEIIERLISQEASFECTPSYQQRQEIKKFNLDIPDTYTDHLNVEMVDNNPIVLAYYINTEYAGTSKVHKLSKSVTEKAEKYGSIQLQHVYDKTSSDRTLGFKLKLNDD